MPDIKISEKQWNPLSAETKTKIEDLINAAFKSPKQGGRYHIVASSIELHADDELQLQQCEIGCQTALDLAMGECDKLSKGASACRWVARQAYSDCIQHCYGLGPK
jgi:uncharacterized protein YozE (UPF0346 family)